MPIITEASCIDRKSISPHQCEPGHGIEAFRYGGRKAGDTAGRQFMSAYGPGSNADVTKFSPALEFAVQTACKQMRASGASLAEIAVWSIEFGNALKPHLDRYARVMGIWQDETLWRPIIN
jgi:hypothetical protein